MNVVIVGGGQKFGRAIAEEFRKNNNQIFILSHRDYEADENHVFADFHNIYDVAYKLNFLTRNINHIDILLYASNHDYGPHFTEYNRNSLIGNIQDYWQKSFHIAVTVPHILAVTALTKMTETSRIVFITSLMSLDLDRTNYKTAASYAGCKAAQNHLMITLSALNDSKAIVYSIATHLPEDNEEVYNNIKLQVYNQLLKIDRQDSGKIIKTI